MLQECQIAVWGCENVFIKYASLNTKCLEIYHLELQEQSLVNICFVELFPETAENVICGDKHVRFVTGEGRLELNLEISR